MRPLIQYELDESPTTPPGALLPKPAAPRPPTKKRKRNHRNLQRHQPEPRKFPPQHWDDPGDGGDDMVYDDEQGSGGAVTADNVGEEEEFEYEEETMEAHDTADAYDDDESRPLTHEELWDDSALIDAWNSAEAEYEAYHGSSKPWKTEPVKKSPLWYNRPCAAPPQTATKKSKPPTPDLEPDTAPLDFDTFVPTHDPSLAVPTDAKSSPNTTSTPFFVPPPSTTTVSRDEAFNNALTAMYWSGYWTAVYHCQSQTNEKTDTLADTAEEAEDELNQDEAEEVLVPAQR